MFAYFFQFPDSGLSVKWNTINPSHKKLDTQLECSWFSRINCIFTRILKSRKYFIIFQGLKAFSHFSGTSGFTEVVETG